MSRPVGVGVLPAIERLKNKIVKTENGCWTYPAKNGNGYGRIYDT